MEKLLATSISKHSRQSWIGFDHLSVRAAEERSLLNTVKQVAVAPLRLEPLTYVNQHMDRLRVPIQFLFQTGRRNQIAAVGKDFDRPFEHFLLVRAKGANCGAPATVDCQDFPNRSADEPRRMNPDSLCECLIDTNDMAHRVMRYNRVMYRVNHPD